MRTWKFYCQKLEAQTIACHLVTWTWLSGRTRGARSANAFARSKIRHRYTRNRRGEFLTRLRSK